MSVGLITALIVEDERDARLLFANYLKLFDEIKLVGEAANAEEALEIIHSKTPDLVFVDIDLPVTDGIELTKTVRRQNIPCQIVFTTAHADKAIDTFDVKPLDYLLKPFGPDEIRQVVSRFQQEIGNRIDSELTKSVDKIRIPVRSGFVFFRPDEIVFCQAQKTTTTLLLVSGEEENTSVSFGHLADFLAQYQFFRVSRSVVINLKYLRRVDKKKRTCQLSFEGKSIEVEISKSNLHFFDDINFFSLG